MKVQKENIEIAELIKKERKNGNISGYAELLIRQHADFRDKIDGAEEREMLFQIINEICRYKKWKDDHPQYFSDEEKTDGK